MDLSKNAFQCCWRCSVARGLRAIPKITTIGWICEDSSFTVRFQDLTPAAGIAAAGGKKWGILPQRQENCSCKRELPSTATYFPLSIIMASYETKPLIGKEDEEENLRKLKKYQP
jgi:hypothetical protein